MTSGKRSSRTRWLRRHRWWLVALPVALVLMFAANSHRISAFYRYADYHHRVAHATAGSWVTVTTHYGDSAVQHTRTVDVRLDSVRPSSEQIRTRYSDYDEHVTLPSDVTAYDVRLSLRKPSDDSVRACGVWLVGSDGEWYGAGSDMDFLNQGTRCWPEDQDDSVLPTSWVSNVVVLAPKDARIVEARVAWERPDYASFTLK